MPSAPKSAKRPHPVGEWEARQIARATHFAVSYRRRDGAFGGRGFTTHNDIPTLDAARELARHHAPAMIYAVTPERLTIAAENAIPDARPRFF